VLFLTHKVLITAQSGGPKKLAPFLCALTLPNINRFSRKNFDSRLIFDEVKAYKNGANFWTILYVYNVVCIQLSEHSLLVTFPPVTIVLRDSGRLKITNHSFLFPFEFNSLFLHSVHPDQSPNSLHFQTPFHYLTAWHVLQSAVLLL